MACYQSNECADPFLGWFLSQIVCPRDQIHFLKFQVINDLLNPAGQNLRVREDVQVSHKIYFSLLYDVGFAYFSPCFGISQAFQFCTIWGFRILKLCEQDPCFFNSWIEVLSFIFFREHTLKGLRRKLFSLQLIVFLWLQQAKVLCFEWTLFWDKAKNLAQGSLPVQTSLKVLG